MISRKSLDQIKKLPDVVEVLYNKIGNIVVILTKSFTNVTEQTVRNLVKNIDQSTRVTWLVGFRLLNGKIVSTNTGA